MMDNIYVNFFVFDKAKNFLDSFILNTNLILSSCHLNYSDLKEIKHLKNNNKIVVALKVDGYFLSVFTHMVKVSELYSKMVVQNLYELVKPIPLGCSVNVKLQMVEPKSEILDYAWNERVTGMISQRQQLEYAMSWLSTLGGAFSALGDSFEDYAKVAGKISLQQFKIAYQLGEPPLVARCRLYMALCLIQLGKLTTAKKLIKNQYKLAINYKDLRLQNMCKGIWAKLQYSYKNKTKCNRF